MRAIECEVCKGAGQYEQTYTIGCGMGSHQSLGKCAWCDGVGYVDFYERRPAAAKDVADLLRAELVALKKASLEDFARAEFERQHSGRNLKQHYRRGAYLAAPIAALWNQHLRTIKWMQSLQQKGGV